MLNNLFRLLLLVLGLMVAISANAQDEPNVTAFFDQADVFFQNHVKGGYVDYQGIKASPEMLDELVAQIAAIDREQLSESQAKAYLINVYNLLVIKGVVDNYPIKSVHDVPGFFKSPYQVGPTQLNLFDLDKQFRADYRDPRLHMVLVRGSESSPKLLDAAYRPETLDRQLDRRTRQILNDTSFIRVDAKTETVWLPSILEDYTEDFPDEGFEVWNWVNAWRIEALNTDNDMEFYAFEWKLNDAAGRMISEKTAVQVKKTKDKKTADPTKPGSGSNVQNYTPSILLKEGQVEVKLFNNLYTQTSWFDGNGDEQHFDQRNTFFTTTVQAMYGPLKSARWNVGLMANIRGVSNDSLPASPTRVFQFRDDNLNRWTPSNIGPSLKIQPLKNLRNLSVLSSLLVPIGSKLEGSPWVDYDRFVWWNQFFYDQKLGDKMRLFFEGDLLFRFPKNNSAVSHLSTPLSTFASYFPTSKSTIYVMGQYAPIFQQRPDCIENPQPWEDNSSYCANGDRGKYYTVQWSGQYGVGGKYQLTKTLEIEALWTDFAVGRSAGAGSTYNIGLRYLK